MTKTVHVGFGPIGHAVFELVLERRLAEPAAIVELDAERVRAEVARDARPAVPVVSSLAELRMHPGTVVVQCTSSRLLAVRDQIVEALQLGASVISTCEELSYPWLDHEEVALEIDRVAHAAGSVVIATGVNPGYVMDALPMFMSTAMRRLDAIRVRRVVDAARRRGPLQSKVGAGLSREAFEELAAAGRIGHVGLRESAAMLSAGTGMAPDSVTTELEPVIADKPVRTPSATVRSGAVAGVHEVAIAWRDGSPLVTLDLSMYVGAPAQVDEVELIGEPSTTVTTSGLHGDVATAAIVANLISEVPKLQPGLRTMIDLVPVRAHPPVGAAGGGP